MQMDMRCVGVLLFVLAKCCVGQVVSDPRNLVSNALGSNMVLQREPQQAVIWGWVPPYAPVNVTFRDPNNNTIVQGVTDADWNGTWSFTLPATPASLQPYSIVVAGGNKTALLTNILFGDVYIISGQSNCITGVGGAFNSTAEMNLAPNYPNIRVWKGSRAPPFMDASNPEMNDVAFNPPWRVPTPEVINGVSAVGWYFVRSLYELLGGTVPMGIMTDCFSSQIECWLSPEGYDQCAHLNPWPCYGNVPNTTYGSKYLVYNSNIYPLIRLRSRGFVMYKGEGEIGRPELWQCTINAMINDYRAKWGYTDPSSWGFYWILTHPWDTATAYGLPELRLAQSSGYLMDNQNAFYVSAVDQGQTDGDIHPSRKQELGRRVALVAAGLGMGLPVVYKGPVVTGYTVLTPDGSVNVTLQLQIDPTSVGSGLVIKLGTSVCPSKYGSSECAGWEVADQYGQWRAGKISFADPANTTVVVTATLPSTAARVTGLRFGYAAWPLCDLYNVEGLPVTPFRFNTTHDVVVTPPPVTSTTAVMPPAACYQLDGWLQEYDTNLIVNMPMDGHQACCDACSRLGACQSWTMLETLCFLLSTPFSYDGARQRPNTASGWVQRPTTAAPIVTTAVPITYAPASLTKIPTALYQNSAVNGWSSGANITFNGTALPTAVVNDSSVRDRDGVFVRCALPAGSASSELRMVRLTSTVPTNAVVTGLQFNAFARASTSGIGPYRVSLIVNNVAQTPSMCPPPNYCGSIATGTGANVTLGGPGSMWSYALTPSVVNNANFGIVLQLATVGGVSAWATIDQVAVTVFYKVPVSTTAAGATTRGSLTTRGTTSTGTTSTGTTSTGTTSTGTTSTGTTSTGTTSTGSTSTGSTSTGTSSSGTTSSGSTGTTSTGSTSSGTTDTTTGTTSTSGTTSTGTTSTGSTSTGSTSTGTTSTGTSQAAGPPQCDVAVDLTGSTGQLLVKLTHAAIRNWPVTMSAWVYSNGLRNKQQTLLAYGVPTASGVMIRLQTNNIVAMYLGAASANSTYVLPVGQWVFLSVVSSGLNTWSIYENGVHQTTVNVAATSPTAPNGKFSIGGQGGQLNQLGNGNFDGKMDNVQIWTVARTPTQLVTVDSLPSYAVNALTGAEPGLVFYVPMSEGSGDWSRAYGSGAAYQPIFNSSGVFSWEERICTAAAGTTSTGTTSTGTTSTGTSSTGTTSTGTTSTGTTSTGTTAAGTTSTGTTSTGTTSTGTTSTGTTSTGTTSTGTTSSTSTTAPAAELCDMGVDFSGSVGQLLIKLNAAATRPWPVTMSAWVYSNGLRNKQQSILSFGVPTGSGVMVRLHTNNIVAVYLGPAYANSTYVLPVGQWVFLSVVSSGVNTWSIYQDGVLQTAVTVTAASPVAPNGKFSVGGQGGQLNQLGNGNFDGKMDNVQIWTVARTPTQLSTIDSLPTYAPNALTGAEPGLHFYLPMNEGAGDWTRAYGAGAAYEPFFNKSGVFSWANRLCTAAPVVSTGTTGTTSTSTGTTSTGTTSTGTTSTGTTSTGTTSTGSTGAPPPETTGTTEAAAESSSSSSSSSSGTTSTGTTSTGTTGTTSTGTTSTGTTSTGTTSTGTTSTGTTAAVTTGTTGPPAVVYSRGRYVNSLMQSATTNGWSSNFSTASNGYALPTSQPMVDATLKGRNSVFVRALVPPGQTSSTLFVVGFSNPIPADATVVGIKVWMTRRASASGLQDTLVALVVGGVVQPASNQCPGAATCVWQTTNPAAVITFGGPTSMWGMSAAQLTPAMVNAGVTASNAGFGYAVITQNNGAAALEALIDQSEMTMYYTVPSAAASVADDGIEAEPLDPLPAHADAASNVVTFSVVGGVVALAAVVAVSVFFVRQRRAQIAAAAAPAKPPAGPDVLSMSAADFAATGSKLRRRSVATDGVSAAGPGRQAEQRKLVRQGSGSEAAGDGNSPECAAPPMLRQSSVS